MPTQIDACAAHAVHGWSPAKNARELKGSARNAIQGAAWGRLSQQRLRLARIEGLGPERRVVPVAQGHGHLFALGWPRARKPGGRTPGTGLSRFFRRRFHVHELRSKGASESVGTKRRSLCCPANEGHGRPPTATAAVA